MSIVQNPTEELVAVTAHPAPVHDPQVPAETPTRGGGAMLAAVSIALGVVVLAVAVTMGMGAWWIVIPLMAVHVLATAGVWRTIEAMLDDDGED